MNTKEFAEKLIKATEEAVIDGSVDALEELEDHNVIYHMPGDQVRLGHEAHKQDILSLRPAITNEKMEMKYLFGDGNVFALSLKSSGRYISEIPTHPVPVGKNFSDDALFFYRLIDNKIAEVWIHANSTYSD
jgi:predicted ester cyclase